MENNGNFTSTTDCQTNYFGAYRNGRSKCQVFRQCDKFSSSTYIFLVSVRLDEIVKQCAKPTDHIKLATEKGEKALAASLGVLKRLKDDGCDLVRGNRSTYYYELLIYYIFFFLFKDWEY